MKPDESQDLKMGDGVCALRAAPGGESICWAVPSANLLAWRVWDDEFLVYNTASGQTHHLNLLAGEVLRSIEVEPAQTCELVRRLANQFEIAEDSPPLQMIDRLIHELDELGLIAPSTA
jgi:PqqD family protein of HPr-rel-A system